MARVTIEDCIKQVNNRFALVALAAHLAKQIKARGVAVMPEQNAIKDGKPPVIALREIASGHVDIDALKRKLVNSLRSKHQMEPVDSNIYSDEQKMEETINFGPSNLNVFIGFDYSTLDDKDVEVFDGFGMPYEDSDMEDK